MPGHRSALVFALVVAVWAAAAGSYVEADAGEPLRALALTQPWFSLGPSNLSGRIQAITFDPTNATTVYAGAAGGGVWKSTDGGRGWAPIGDDLPSLNLGAIAVVPRD